MKKILIVKKDISNLLSLKFQLNQHGYESVHIANSYESTVKKVDAYRFDIVIIDVLLSGRRDGIHISEFLKMKSIPFAFLISDCNEEIIEYVKTVATQNILLHPIKLNKIVNIIDATNTKEVKPNIDIINKITQSIKLTKKELQCLRVLYLKNSYMSHEQLEKEVWPAKSVGEGTLRSLIRRVRNKLGEESIQSVHGFGYKLNLKNIIDKDV